MFSSNTTFNNRFLGEGNTTYDRFYSYRNKSSTNSTNSAPEGFPLNGNKTLFIGEGNFSFSLAWLEKHMNELRAQGLFKEADQFPKTLISTEIKPRNECERDSFTRENIRRLEGLGSLVLFEVDGQTIDTNPNLRKYSITRVQGNCLDNHSIFCADDCELPNIIVNTAHAASRVLKEGDTFQLILISPRNNWRVWQAIHYEAERVEEAGFYLNEGRPTFTGQIEYPTYRHNKTEGAEEGQVVEAAQLDEMIKLTFVRHPTQRTPARYKSSLYGFKQLPVGNKLIPTQLGNYRYYSTVPGRPCSPVISPPSFFEFDSFSPEKEETRPVFDLTSEESDCVDEFDYNTEFDDYSDMHPKQLRAHLRNRCSKLVKRMVG